ncbi:MAG: pectinesterase family protein [Polyangiaceae bacterium]
MGLVLFGCADGSSGGPESGHGGAAQGGQSNNGGSASGGTTGNGGSSNGGASNGGASSGGAANGGSSNGGSSNGGSSNGGSSNGGAASGGASNGGSANGGSSNGGSSSGGASSGGANSGGRSTSGGSSSGGTASGGTASGGSSSGGTSSGGAASGGVVGSGGQTNLPTGVTALFPVANSTGVCPDPSLRITFSGAPTLGTSGKIQVFNSSGTAVASVDMSAATVSDTIGGTVFNRPLPVFVDGNTAIVYLKNKALAYNQTYYVTVDSGAIKPPSGTFSVTGNSAWKFTTASAAPSSLAALTVSLTGAGNFCSVQGALDALPANNTAASRITINSGTYHEIIKTNNKSNITLHGQDRKATIIAATNNNVLNPSTVGRALVGLDNTNGLVIENLTIHNLTPQGGSQAEALRLGSCDKCIVRDADILSLQDTLLWGGRVYAENCLIAGNVDYISGSGVAYFNKCEIRTVGRSGVIVQSRNAVGAYGYVFVDSKITADSAATSNALARIDAAAYPGSHVAYINCQMTNVSAAGWTITNTATSSLRFWEYQSTDANGNALSMSGRVGGSTRITDAQAATMRDKAQVLNGWAP